MAALLLLGPATAEFMAAHNYLALALLFCGILVGITLVDTLRTALRAGRESRADTHPDR